VIGRGLKKRGLVTKFNVEPRGLGRDLKVLKGVVGASSDGEIVDKSAFRAGWDRVKS
jgi:hypothetical protein